jgi:hypothetical protein
MKIVEQTATKLAFSIGVPYFNATQCDFDRTTDRGTIKRTMMFWPMKTLDIPLSEISAVRLAVATTSTPDTGSYSKSYPEILCKSGRRIAMASFRESSSKKAVEAMKAFLGFGA